MALFNFLSTAATTRFLSKLKTHLAAYLKTSDLDKAVDDALAQAKQSGEFDGKDGTSVTVTNVSTSAADGGSNVVTFSDGTTVTIKNGSKGSQGIQGEQGKKGDTGATGPQGPQGPTGPAYTLTTSDKTAIANQVKATFATETWTFKLKDGSTVTKTVVIG